MSIPENDGIVYLTATGGEVNLAFDFKIYDKDYIQVTRYVGATPTLFVLGTNYTIADNQVGVDGGGVLALTVPAVIGEIYILQLNVPYERATNFNQAGDFFAAAVNRELDLITQQIQQIRRDGGRSIALDPIINLTSSTVREAPVDGMTLMWDGASGYIINGPSGVDILNAGPNAAIAAQAAIDAINANAAAQSAAAGMKWRPSVRAATTANLAALSGLLTIDGITLTAGDRVLVKDQTTQSTNGVYIAAAGAWTRATDADTWTELVSQVVAPEQGTTQADVPYICTVNQGGTLGVTAVTWTILPVPIQDNAVTTAKILNGAVTYAKVATAAIATTVADIIAGTANTFITASLFQLFRTTPPILRLQCTKASGTNGGQRAATGSWQDSNSAAEVLLNTVVTNNITGASIASGVITLPAGTYKIRGFKTFYNTAASRVRFFNITDGVGLVVGSSTYASGSAGTGDSRFDDTFFTIAGTKTIKMQTWVSGSSGAAFDLGVAVATGDTEIYGDFTFEKVS